MFQYLVVIYNQLRQYFLRDLGKIKEQSSSMKGKKYEILENQHTKYMKGCKDKKIRKKKTGPDKK